MALTATNNNVTPPTHHPIPIVFTPTQIPGFTDYASTFSEFRILKASCKVHMAVPGDSTEQALLANQPYTFLRVASRPFIEHNAILASSGQGGSPTSITEILRDTEPSISELRQSRWQRQYYPSDIKNSLTFKFYPYTLEWSGKPVGYPGSNNANDNRLVYLKYRSARRWMPMSFLGEDMGPTASDDVSFLGPYFIRLFSTQPDTQAVQQYQPICNLSIWVQFRGQR